MSDKEEITMAFFGMDSTQVKIMPEKLRCEEVDCLLCETSRDAQAHCLFRQLRAEDVVFLKKFTPQNGLVILAAGVITPGSLVENDSGTCAHVHWEWSGEKQATKSEDMDETRGNAVYEEFDLGIQREIMDLLPDSGHDPYRRVMEASLSRI